MPYNSSGFPSCLDALNGVTVAWVLKCKKRIKKQLDVKIVCLCYTSQKFRSSRILIQKDNFLFSRLITWQVKHFKPFLLFSLFAFSSWEVRHLVYQIIRIFPMTYKWTGYTALFYYQSTLCKMPHSPIHFLSVLSSVLKCFLSNADRHSYSRGCIWEQPGDIWHSVRDRTTNLCSQ